MKKKLSSDFGQEGLSGFWECHHSGISNGRSTRAIKRVLTVILSLFFGGRLVLEAAFSKREHLTPNS